MCTWIFSILLYLSLEATASGLQRIPVKPMIIEASTESTAVWSMRSLFGEEFSNKAISYQIEGTGPCAVQNPYLMFKNIYKYNEEKLVIDFTMVDTDIYYLVRKKLHLLNVLEFVNDNSKHSKEILDASDNGFVYINGFQMFNGDRILFLKEAGSVLHYIIITKEGQMLDIKKTREDFDEFKEEMRMVVFHNYVIIPAGTKGIILYQYSEQKHDLIYFKTLTNVKEAKDVAVKFSESSQALIFLVADYQQGLVRFRMNMDTAAIEAEDVLKEFVKAKSITLVSKDDANKVLLIIDALGGSSKYVVLTFNKTDEMTLNYDQIRLLDGKASYGDSNEDYASIIMYNSVMIMKITQESDSMVGYVNSQGVNNAKLLKLPGGDTTWLVHSDGFGIMVTDVIGSSGFLVCHTGETAESHSFAILNQAKNCKLPVEGQIASNCYYFLMATLNVINRESLDELKFIAMLVGSIIGVMVLIIAIIMFIVYCKLKVTNNKIAQYVRMSSRQDTPKIDA